MLTMYRRTTFLKWLLLSTLVVSIGLLTGVTAQAQLNPAVQDVSFGRIDVGVHLGNRGVYCVREGRPDPGIFKIAENTSPIPQDRVFFSFDFFNNVAPATGISVWNADFGSEELFFNGEEAVELRIPFAEPVSLAANPNTDLNLFFIDLDLNTGLPRFQLNGFDEHGKPFAFQWVGCQQGFPLTVPLPAPENGNQAIAVANQ